MIVVVITFNCDALGQKSDVSVVFTGFLTQEPQIILTK